MVINLINSQSKTEESDHFGKFQNFTKNFERKFDDLNSLSTSYANFKKTLSKINALNSNNTHTDPEVAKFGINKFADVAEEDFRQTYLNYVISEKDYHSASKETTQAVGRNLQTTKTTQSASAIATAPLSYDWRNFSAVTNVKDQGTCGDCWAFTSAAAIETQYFLKHGDLINFSSQQLLDCDHVSNGCNGGSAGNAYNYLINGGGLYPSNSYSQFYGGKVYLNTNNTCKANSNYLSSTVNLIAKVNAWYVLPAGNEANMATYVSTVGPLSVAINADWLQNYVNGIIVLSTCSTTVLNHAVLIVGYGVSTVSGIPYWIVKNSWGPNWGENGYFRMQRGVGRCGIDQYVSYPTVA